MNATKSPQIGASLGEQMRSFNRVFWLGNTMEMVERLAYYGLRAVVALYIVSALEDGGPQFTHIQKGSIFAIWAAIQSFVPIFTGGYADKYGYKLTVAISVAIKIVGYFVMAYAIDLAAITTGGSSSGVPGHDTVYWFFLVGAGLLALGTAVFKPGIQGIIALQLSNTNSSLGWSLFYQVVNVGGWLGPYLAGAMRVISWKWVFIACAIIVALNYLLLMTFPEPEKEQLGLEEAARVVNGPMDVLRVLWDSFIGICEPRLIAFLVIFSGFWAMFHQLFDLLPNYIEDWVDSSMLVSAMTSVTGIEAPKEWLGMVPPEHMININAMMCMLLAFIIGYWTGKVRSMTAMIAGIVVSAIAIYGIGVSTNGWWIVGCIATFSLGELMSSPTKMRYFASIAPPGKKGMYLGYVNATGGIGWALGSLIAGAMYEQSGDKVVLARRYLTDKLGQDAQTITAMAKTEIMPHLASLTNQSVDQARELLYTTYDPTYVWTHFALIGVVSMVGLICFDLITRLKMSSLTETSLLLVVMALTAGYTYGVKWMAVFCVMLIVYKIVESVRPEWLPQGQTPHGDSAAKA